MKLLVSLVELYLSIVSVVCLQKNWTRDKVNKNEAIDTSVIKERQFSEQTARKQLG